MFILSWALFLTASYLRPRTEADLSYIAAAIEVLSGLLCLLQSPWQLQVCLLLVFVINRASSKHHRHLAPLTQQKVVTLDVQAEAVEATPWIPVNSPTQGLPQAQLEPVAEHTVASLSVQQGSQPAPKASRQDMATIVYKYRGISYQKPAS
ncbi:hypothetical protein [Lyngbya confervoides]|uniref:Uncharacterized protein n=1 Tax=Lyngbya confervoides BDU141951 TaxID=1574623 RepID=A0ABD4T6B7_9CYAN|nr:hypothetical protein [Lyngbya confervoides]MCM1984258.1 hypothetical protein [Lyngbya confervoides BDU141951]